MTYQIQGYLARTSTDNYQKERLVVDHLTKSDGTTYDPFAFGERHTIVAKRELSVLDKLANFFGKKWVKINIFDTVSRTSQDVYVDTWSANDRVYKRVGRAKTGLRHVHKLGSKLQGTTTKAEATNMFSTQFIIRRLFAQRMPAPTLDRGVTVAGRGRVTLEELQANFLSYTTGNPQDDN